MTVLRIHGGTVVGINRSEMADVLISDGVIERLDSIVSPTSFDENIDAKGLLLFPGLIDCHVHFREPGLTHKADMKSEAAAARAGGMMTVCEMPNTVPPTVTVEAFADKVRRAEGITDCDLRFFFGATERSHLEELKILFSDPRYAQLRKRCSGLKLFLDHSTGNQKADPTILNDIFAFCAEQNIVVVCHCEDPEMNERAKAEHAGDDVSLHSLQRPPESEVAAIELVVGLARAHGTRLHVAHLSTAAGLELVRAAKAEKLTVTCEAAPHHLFLTTDDYATLGTRAKVNPPLRSTADRDALWAGLVDGTVDCIATDHAPHTAEEKNKQPPLAAPSGLPGVETSLALLLTAAAGVWPHGEGKPPVSLRYLDILRLCFSNPNKIFGLGKKGIKGGAPADLLLVDPKATWTITAATMKGRTGWTPYEGWSVRGKIVRIIR